MRTPWALRPRVPGVQVIDVPGIVRQGHIPVSISDTSTAEVRPVGYYQFHLGDVFTPGTGNWIPDPAHDTQLFTIWGHGSLRAQSFEPVPPGVAQALLSAPYDSIRGTIIQGLSLEHLQNVAGESVNG